MGQFLLDPIEHCVAMVNKVLVEIGRDRTALDGARRYRVMSFSFDLRSRSMDLEIEDHWDEEIKEQHRENHRKLIAGFAAEFGAEGLDAKLANFRSLGVEPISVYSVHNELLQQVRRAFVIGAYYPALVGAASLGERILNQIMLALRDKYFGTHAATKRVRNKKSLNDWDALVQTLRAWDVISDVVAAKFLDLKQLRHNSVHFGIPNLHESGGRGEALKAIALLQEIIGERFGTFAPQLLIPGTSGVFYLRRVVEDEPFVREFYLPSCALLSPRGGYQSMVPVIVEDDLDYDMNTQLSDSEFIGLLDGSLSIEAARKANLLEL